MKPGIHPSYGEATIVCACGATFKTRSTIPLIRLEICSSCHPFFTGKHKLVDTAGRIERFQRRYATTGLTSPSRKAKKVPPQKRPGSRGMVLTTTPKRTKQEGATRSGSATASPVRGTIPPPPAPSSSPAH